MIMRSNDGNSEVDYGRLRFMGKSKMLNFILKSVVDYFNILSGW